MVVSLNKKWKEFLYGSCFFGPNVLFVMLGAYFTDALNPAGLTANVGSWSLSKHNALIPLKKESIENQLLIIRKILS